MKPIRAALIGNPNCGKSTLFNALTGSHQKVGNWPGVTVDRKSGFFEEDNRRVQIIDLPGVYSLITTDADAAIDTCIACEAIMSGDIDLIINIVDATNLERHLYLTTQLLEMQIPMIVAVNMLDVTAKRGIKVDLIAFSNQLGCKVVGLSAYKKTGIKQLKEAILNYEPRNLTQQHPILETTEEAEIHIANARYTKANQIAQSVIQKTSQANNKTLTQRIDGIVLHRIWGIPIFLLSMYLMFFFSINIGHAFQPFFDQGSEAIFVDGLGQLLNFLHVPDAVTALMTLGIGKGINTVVTFIPLLGCLFLWLSFLESSGYMARAAFVIDRVMRAMGLPGKSFVPLIVGFGCNVPAILAARTLEHRRDRLLTLMMTPFMSCGARLAIYGVFTAAFFTQGAQNIVFILYLIGIFMAVMTGFVLRKTVLQGQSSPWLVELPTYHFPTPAVLLRATWHRLKAFVINAGRYIVPVCFLIGALNAFTIDGHLAPEPDKGSPNSVLSVVGKAITPVFAPMGIQSENWPATVGLASGVLAKEVVVGTLNTLYTQVGGLSAAPDETFHFIEAMKKAVLTIPEQLAALKNSFSNPIAASGSDATMDGSVLGVMSHNFDGKVGAMAYLLFVLLYFPCISATAALARESSKNWALFSVLWTTGLAYVVAVVFYQAATWAKHPVSSASWVIGLSLLLVTVLGGIKFYARGTTFHVLPTINSLAYIKPSSCGSGCDQCTTKNN